MGKGIFKYLNPFFTWVTRIVYLNLLWLLFTLIGFGVFGLFPATIAMLTVTKSWLQKEEVPIFNMFFRTYKTEFWKANFLGSLILIIGFILLLDYKLVFNPETNFSTYIQIIFLFVGLIYVITVLYILSLFTYLDMEIKEYIKNAIVLVFTYPFQSLVLVLGFMTIGYLTISYAGVLLLFSGSTISLLITIVTQNIITNIKQRSLV